MKRNYFWKTENRGPNITAICSCCGAKSTCTDANTQGKGSDRSVKQGLQLQNLVSALITAAGIHYLFSKLNVNTPPTGSMATVLNALKLEDGNSNYSNEGCNLFHFFVVLNVDKWKLAVVECCQQPIMWQNRCLLNPHPTSSCCFPVVSFKQTNS